MKWLWTVKISSLLILTLFVVSCNGQNKTNSISSKIEEIGNTVTKPENGFNSGFLDSDGILWFGSNGGGVYRYDGVSYTNFSEADRLCNNQVNSILEDKEGHRFDGFCLS